MTKTFNCSMCSAPLDLSSADNLTLRCHYCGNTTILPEELRPVPNRAPSPGGTFLSIMDRALKMAEISQLLHAGNKIAAIKVYRETFGVGLAEAKAAVEQMASGHAVSVTGNQALFGQPNQSAQLGHVVNLKGRKIGRWIVAFVILLVLVPIIFAAVGIISAFKAVKHSTPTFATDAADGRSRRTTPPFASPVFEFGGEGIGAGQFKDARSVAVDGDGRIYVGEYLGGRVQVFDAQGKFITQWMLDPKAALFDLEVDRKGVVYVVQPKATYRYNASTGEPIGQVVKPAGRPYETYYDVEVGLDGSLYALAGPFNLVHIAPDGSLRADINLREKTSDDASFERLAVDGQGNIYVLSRGEQTIFKLAPNGKFINRFGGRGSGPGQFNSANSIAVDGQGRVYVSDSGRGIHVFENDGRYLDTFGGTVVIFGIAINDRNEIFATERNRFKIVKYVLEK